MAETCWRCGYFRCKCNTSEYEQSRIVKKQRQNKCKNYDKLQTENKRLKEALVGDGPYSLLSCLTILSDAAKHLLEVHNYDGHGYEQIEFARDAALQHKSNIEQALGGE